MSEVQYARHEIEIVSQEGRTSGTAGEDCWVVRGISGALFWGEIPWLYTPRHAARSTSIFILLCQVLALIKII